MASLEKIIQGYGIFRGVFLIIGLGAISIILILSGLNEWNIKNKHPSKPKNNNDLKLSPSAQIFLGLLGLVVCYGLYYLLSKNRTARILTAFIH